MNTTTTSAREREDQKILAYGAKIDEVQAANEAVRAGKSYAEFVEMVLEKGGLQAPAEPPTIGMGRRDIEQFSLLRLVRAEAEPNNPKLRREAGLEYEACAAQRSESEKAGYLVRGNYSIPNDVLLARPKAAKRDLIVGPGGTGQYLVDTEQMSMVEQLDNAMMVKRLGARVFNGLTGDVAFPKNSGGVTCYWVGEGDDITAESDPTFGQVMMRPKTIGVYTDLTRRQMIQSSLDIEYWLRGRQAEDIALGVDLAAIAGSGSGNQPLGLLNTTGIGSVAGGTNGAAPTYAHMCELEREVSRNNAVLRGFAFLTSPDVRFKLRQTPENSSVPGSAWVFTGSGETEAGRILGYPAYVTNQVPDTLTKGASDGVCSAIIAGSWTELYIGYWSGISVNVDTTSLSKSGGVRVVSLLDVDVAIPRPQAFAVMADALAA